MSDEYKQAWFIVPQRILDIEGLTLAFLKVYETIFQFWNHKRKCYLSNPEIERRTGVGITQIKEAISFFEKRGELERIQIGIKRYLIEPIKIIQIDNTPNLSIVDKVAAPPASCTKISQVAAPPATKNCTGGRSSGLQVAAPPATEIKNRNKENKNITPISPAGKVLSFSLSEMLADNPFNISEDVLSDWIEVRKGKKAKLTATAWNQANTNLAKLKEAGLCPIECFLKAVASGWSGIEFRYFKQDIESLNPKPNKYATKEERAANDQKSRELENKAAQAKREEIEASKGFKAVMAEVKNRRSKSELDAEMEAERIALGMTKMEHAQYVLNKPRTAD